jgi:hypothetical protein
MAAKPSTRKAKKKTRRPKVVATEVDPDSPTPLAPEVLEKISAVELSLMQVAAMSETKLTTAIRRYSDQATRSARDAVTAGALGIVSAWACGKLLNEAKDKRFRGDFGSWRKQNFGDDVMSERTSQRYMKLARECNDVRDLLNMGASLRQAYVACGVLPEPPEREPVEKDESEAAKRQAFLASVTVVQKQLRTLAGFGGRLEEDERTQLTLARREIDAFFDQILG